LGAACWILADAAATAGSCNQSQGQRGARLGFSGQRFEQSERSISLLAMQRKSAWLAVDILEI
jgi:hypothetical protein